MNLKKGLRVLLVVLLAVAAGLAQALLSPRQVGMWPVFDLPLVVLVVFATQHPSLEAIGFGWLAGLSQDFFTGELLGLNAFSKMSVSVLVLFCLGWTEVKGFGFSLAMVVLGTFVEVFTGNIMASLAGKGMVPLWLVSGHMLLGNVLLFSALYLLVRRRSGRE